MKNLSDGELSFANSGYGFNVTAQFKNLPIVTISYMPFTQIIDGVANNLYSVNQSSILSAYLQYTVRSQSIINTMSGSFLAGKNEITSDNFEYNNAQLILNNLFQYKRSLSINSSAGIGFASTDTTTQYTFLDLNINYQLKKLVSTHCKYSRNISSLNLSSFSSYSLGVECKVLKSGRIRATAGYREFGSLNWEITERQRSEWFCEFGMFLRI
ncbi:MAG: hypothetical protein KDC92_10975 [Bacteroidetes bacterium]|nr:hypothetical protein [Bacteroidota bacterium]